MSDAGIPTHIDFDEDDIKREAAETGYKDGAIVKTVCVAASIIKEETRGKGPGSDFVLKTAWSPLDPSNGSTPIKGAPRLNVRNVLPVRDPENKETHLPPEYAKNMWAAFCEAAFPEDYGPGPRMEGGQLKYMGKVVTDADKERIKVERAKKRLELVNKVLANPKELLRTVCFGTIKVSGEFTNLNGMKAELPKDKELTAVDDLFVERLAGGEEEAPAKGNGKAPKTEAPAKRSRR